MSGKRALELEGSSRKGLFEYMEAKGNAVTSRVYHYDQCDPTSAPSSSTLHAHRLFTPPIRR